MTVPVSIGWGSATVMESESYPTEINAMLARIRILYSRPHLSYDEIVELQRLAQGMDMHLTDNGDFPRDWKPF